jgi:hypothetical protein
MSDTFAFSAHDHSNPSTLTLTNPFSANRMPLFVGCQLEACTLQQDEAFWRLSCACMHAPRGAVQSNHKEFMAVDPFGGARNTGTGVGQYGESL